MWCAIFLQPTRKEEIGNIISFLNSNWASGPNSIPYRIGKVPPILRKIQNLIIVTIVQCPCYYVLRKYLKIIYIKDCIPFLNNNNIICYLQFGFRQHYSTTHALIITTENVKLLCKDKLAVEFLSIY